MEERSKPYVVSRLTGVGRCLLASRDLDPMEVIMVDEAAVTGPDESAEEVVCVACYGPLRGEAEDGGCHMCGLQLLCSQDCASSPSHSKFECEFLKNNKSAMPVIGSDPIKFCRALLPLRMLLLKLSRPDKFDPIGQLMDHNEERKEKQPDVWQHYQENVVQYLLKDLNMSEKGFSEDDVNRCLGIVRTNGIETRNMTEMGDGNNNNGHRRNARSVFPNVSILSHACVCNARCVQLEDFTIEIRAQVPIAKGDEITISYTSLLSGNSKRRKLLNNNWCFDCQCKRCIDPTEFGSHLDSFICPKCTNIDENELLVLNPEDALDVESDLKCSKCGYKMTRAEANKREEKLEKILGQKGSRGVKELEELIAVATKELCLHPTNALVMRTKSLLLSLLGSSPGHLYHQLSIEQVQRKVQLCTEFIQVMHRIDPGCSDWRGCTMYELAQSLATLAQRKFDSGENDVEKFRKELNNVIGLYQESSLLLDCECDGTHCKDLAFRARRQLADTKDLIRFAEFLQ